MRHSGIALAFLGLVCAAFGFMDESAKAAPKPQAEPELEAAASEVLTTEEQRILLEDYCIMCHSDAAKTGGLTLESFDPALVVENAETAEKMIRKLRTGMMPPSIAPRPEDSEIAAFAKSLEFALDDAWRANPNPGLRTFQRLNRSEYARAVKDLLTIDVDVSSYLPPDTISHSFDNIADVQAMSATLLEGYMRAAGEISRLAVGDPTAAPGEKTYKVSRTASQMEHVEGAPMGTRGGLSVIHNFPADGEYVFKIQLHGTPVGLLFGLTAGDQEQIEVSVNGERVALLDIDPLLSEADENGLIIETEPIFVKAGPHRLSAAFPQRWEGPIDDLVAPIAHTLADTTIGRAWGITSLPHLRYFSVNGPYNVTGVSETPSRDRIFSCRPISAADEGECAQQIVGDLATQAYRRPLEQTDIEGLMSFYEQGAEDGDFEGGVRTAVQAILASPHFVFRLERRPQDVASGESYPISDVDLASRLSFFLWATAPDEELLSLATDGKLREPQVLEQQVERMLLDARAESLATRFGSQWLRLQDLDKIHPDALLYPYYDHTLAEAMLRETELFFESVIRENRNVLELITADYTFVNERLAEHYEIPQVTGSQFRKVTLPAERRGVLAHGSVLTSTSLADRTSPVNRGKWIMEVLLGTPPPPPPPNVPLLDATTDAAGGKVLSVREAMEMHRANPACNSCHIFIDPLGLSLENFDVTGKWRIKDNGVPVDASGELYDGSAIDGLAGLREALLKYKNPLITTFTESLMTYALGRRVEYYDMPAVRQIVADAAEQDYRAWAFIKAVVMSPAFQMKQFSEASMTTEEQGS
jgi:hypothetical protein